MTVATDLAPWVDAAARAAGERDRPFKTSTFAVEVARIAREQGAAGRASFLRRVMQALVERGRPGIGALQLPDAVKALIEGEYSRIESELAAAGDEHYDLARHSMRCDFRIVGFGRIPVGLGHIEVGGVPRRLLWSGGAAQAWRASALLTRAGGWAPFYVAHFTHDINPMAFLLLCNPKTQATYHGMLADCLRMNPHIRGVVASSWWYDPSLAKVAPHLTFLREGCVAHGAVLLRSGFTEGALRDALAHSPRRQQLYAAGQYVPQSYVVVWARQDLLRWADGREGTRANSTTDLATRLR